MIRKVLFPIFASASLLIVIVACSHLKFNQSVNRNVANAWTCEPNPEYSPLFTVIENNQKQIVVEFGDFASVLQLSSKKYQYQVWFKGSKEDRKAKDEVLVVSGEVNQSTQQVIVPVGKTGVYNFKIFQKESSPFWKQKVFAIAPSEHLLSEDTKKELAEKYAPVLSLHDREPYRPVSLEYLTNQVEVSEKLAEEPFTLTNRKVKSLFSFSADNSVTINFPFKDLRRILPYYGHTEAVLRSDLESKFKTALRGRYGKGHETVYYSVFENPKWKEIYINYHFFYSYDPKNGSEDNPKLASHIFDRESMTVVLRAGSFKPLMVFYGAHLPSQTMAHLSPSGEVLQKWDSGRVFVNWPEVKKINDRPVPAIALGSHGVYPKAADYAVLIGQIKILTESAGGNQYLYPETMSQVATLPKGSSYKLQDLKLDQVTSDCRNPFNILSFSGYTVDVLGPTNATFPPYTDREEDYFSYSDPNAPMFEMGR